MRKLEGQVALVTGASRGIGRAIASALAVEGAHLHLVARSRDGLEGTAEAVRAAGAPAVDLHDLDATDGPALDRLTDELLTRHGTVDVLVNNAGMSPGGDALEGDPDAWTTMMQLNVLAPMRLTRRLAPAMVERERGVIINIGSIAAIEGMTRSGAYAASKHALRGWSLSTYQRLRAHGIKVVLINPAFVDTPMTAGIPDVQRDRMLTPQDVAEAAMLAFRTRDACCPEEIVLRLTRFAKE